MAGIELPKPIPTSTQPMARKVHADSNCCNKLGRSFCTASTAFAICLPPNGPTEQRVRCWQQFVNECWSLGLFG